MRHAEKDGVLADKLLQQTEHWAGPAVLEHVTQIHYSAINPSEMDKKRYVKAQGDPPPSTVRRQVPWYNSDEEAELDPWYNSDEEMARLG